MNQADRIADSLISALKTANEYLKNKVNTDILIRAKVQKFLETNHNWSEGFARSAALKLKLNIPEEVSEDKLDEIAAPLAETIQLIRTDFIKQGFPVSAFGTYWETINRDAE